jgi:hypothetical protein
LKKTYDTSRRLAQLVTDQYRALSLALAEHPEEAHLGEVQHVAGPGEVLLVEALQPRGVLAVPVIEHMEMAHKILQE